MDDFTVMIQSDEVAEIIGWEEILFEDFDED